MARAGGKRTITGFKTFGKKAVRFVGRYALKGLAKGAELGAKGGANAINSLADSKKFQVISTMGGLVGATVICPPVALAFAGLAGANFLAGKVLDEPDTNILNSVKQTILLTNKLTTKFVCDKIVSPLSKAAGEKIEELGENAQDKIDELFEEK